MIELPDFEITETLHEGSVSTVYRARGPDGPVVLKCLTAPYPTAAQRAAYQSEFDILSRLSASGVAHAREIRQAGHAPILVLESIDAPTLRVALDGKSMRVKDFLGFAQAAVRALGEVHAAGVIHKDLNPDNILFDPATGEVHLIDFDIATELPREQPSIGEVTQVEGTLPYISPEQTGRMNRSLDSRSDLYSLGATFYEALTGKPPFESDHPMGVLHGHIARVPRPPHELAPMPQVLSEIVLKLLAKDAGERYQTCTGLLHDLENCDRQLRETYAVADFRLGQRDRSLRFELPQKLYGREKELAVLRDGFERVCAGQTGILMVAGYSGIGKSSLVNSVHRPLVRERGRFIRGKYDLRRRDKPLSAILQAFRDLVVQIIVEDDADFWKREIELALGSNIGVVAKEIPELQYIVEEQEPLPEVGAIEARNRLHFAFQRFVSVFARRESPLVIFLDDLQWADQASLGLIQAILTNPEGRYLYFMGCYRDHEVGPDHPLISTLESVERVHGVDRITLPPLRKEHLEELVTDAFRTTREESAQLAEILIEKTNGNPFFVGEFLRALNQAGLFTYDVEHGEWTWDTRQIRQLGPTDNVSQLMTSRLNRLQEPARRILMLAACIGAESRETTLVALTGKDTRAIQADLAEGVAEGVIMRTRGGADRSFRYRFAHDRVQQSAYSLLPESERPARHLQIGRHLLAELTPANRESRLFDVVDQLNAGRARIGADEELLQLAALNLEAGRRAKASAAFEPALSYFSIGMDLLGDDPWSTSPDLQRALSLERGESEFLNGHHEASERLLSDCLEHAHDALEAMPAYAIRIASHNAQGRFVDSIGISIEALAKLGIELPSDPEAIQQATGTELERVRTHLASREIEDLIDLPKMADPQLIEALRILVMMTSTAYIGYPPIYPLIVARQINLSIEHGNAPHSPVAYSSYAVLNSPGGLGDLDTSYRFGELSLAMLDRDHNPENATNINFVFGTFVSHWRNHISASLQYLDTACMTAVELGDFEYVRYSTTFEAFYTVLMWRDLQAALEACDRRRLMLQRLGLERASGAFMLARQLTLTLSGQTDPEHLVGPDFDENAAHAQWLELNDFLSLSCLAISRLIVSGLYRRRDTVELVAAAQPFLVANTGMFLLAEFQLAAALAFTDAAWEADEETRATHLASARESLEMLETWAAKSPQNMQHRVLLVRAEVMALERDPGVGIADVVNLYEEAGASAREHGFLLHEGIAYERAADYCERVGLARFAGSLLNDAIYAFDRLGARPKADLLRQRSGEKPASTVRASATVRAASVSRARSGIDPDSFLRAGHAISEAIQMDVLLSELMEILIETAGAQRGALIRASDSGLWVAATRAADDPEVHRLQAPLDEASWIAESIVRYALRTQEPLVLDDASREGPFQDDHAISRTGTRSVLCLPVVYQGRVDSLLYLCNNLSAGAFTEDRIEGLRLLTGQIAVSLKNAELYEQLEEKVEERTRQLNVRNRFIRQAFGRYMSDDIAETLLESPEGLTLGGERREVTILMADLRGFTPLTDQLPPEKIVSIVNNFLGEMIDLVFRHQGTVNEFLGDAILAIFGAPIPGPDHAEHAVACAIEMQLAMEHVNSRNRKLGLPDVEMGISVHTGDVVVGNVGSEKRAKYGVVGRPVNIAARIQSYTVGGEVLVSEHTLARVAVPVTTGRELEVHPRGVSEPMKVAKVIGIAGDHGLYLHEDDLDLAGLDTPVEVRYQALNNADATQGFCPGRIVRLASIGAGLTLHEPQPLYTNLRIRLPGPGDAETLDVYGKVMKIEQDGIHVLRFTSVPAEARGWFESLLADAGAM